jgi:hypothetical protein
MKYFHNVISQRELKIAYRRLALAYHPDLGGNEKKMKEINEEYNALSKEFFKKAVSLKDVKAGNLIYVNNTECIVTEVDKNVFKAKSLLTQRETYFSKTTGYAMLNYRFKASVEKQ